MKRCSFCEWIPILPWPVWPLAGQCSLGQNTVVGSMLCSSWLCVAACQKKYVGIPIFVTSELHHGSVQSYPHNTCIHNPLWDFIIFGSVTPGTPSPGAAVL